MSIERSYVEHFVQLLQQQAEVASDLSDLRKEAKGNGFDPKALLVIARRQIESADKRAARLALEDEIARIEAALGALAHTPLGQSAMERAAL
jgi:uncharacterized protein (UPF0335 family)